MAKRKSNICSSDREKNWVKVFNASVKLSQNLLKDRNVLEDRIKYLHDVIYTLKMERKVESAKAELLLGLKEREAFNYKHRYEDADDELNDFKEWFDYLSQKCAEAKDISNDMSCKGQEQKNKALLEEVRRVKTEFEKFKSEKCSEISALLSEKNFLWVQYKNMESQLDTKFRKKCDEVDNANEMVQVMVNRADELQLSNENLRTDISKMESELSQKNQEISGLLKEIAVFKSGSQSATHILRKCTAESRATHMGGKTSSNNRRVATKVKQESDRTLASEKGTAESRATHMGGKTSSNNRRVATKVKQESDRTLASEKGSDSSKSNEVDIITIPDSPKLFTSSFKVLKSNEVDIITIPDSPKLFTSSFKVPKLKSQNLT